MKVTTKVKTFEDYQAYVSSTTVHRDHVYPVLGLAGECGEFVELIKKMWREVGDEWPTLCGPHTPMNDQLKSELGDILWYLTRIASNLGISLETIANENKAKILERKAKGKLKAVV